MFISSAINASSKCGIEKFKNYQIQYCFYKGNGPVLVLEAPLGDNMTVWPKPFLQKINKFAAVLVYNRIGHEKSYFYQSRVMHSVTAKMVAKHLRSLLERLNIHKPIVIIGHSIGGLYAQYFARNHPENVVAIILIDASSSFEPQVNSPFITKAHLEKNSIAYYEMLGYNESINQINDSPIFPNIPLLVITATNHGMDKKTEQWWQELQMKIVQQSSKGEQIVANGKGHFVYQEAPGLVIEGIHKFIHSNHIN